MPQNGMNDYDVESMIELLYMISDALHIAEDGSVDGLESTADICEILSNAQSKTASLLARASEKRSTYLNCSVVYESDKDKTLVLARN